MCGKSYLRISSLRKVSEVVAAKIIFSKNDLRLGCKSSDQAIFVPPSRRFWADMAHAFKKYTGGSCATAYFARSRDGLGGQIYPDSDS